MGLENLLLAAKSARESGFPFPEFIDRAIEIAKLEIEEDANCPVPNCLAELIRTASEPKSEKSRLANLELVRILDLRDQHFKHRGEDGYQLIYSPR